MTDARAYQPGEWYGVIGPRVVLTLPPQERSRVPALWALVDEGAGFEEVLDALISGGLRDLAGFVLLGDDDGLTRVVVRGTARAVLVAGGEQVELDGSQASTWVERTLHDVTSTTLELAEAAADAPTHTVGHGLVRVSRITDATDPADPATPATASYGAPGARAALVAVPDPEPAEPASDDDLPDTEPDGGPLDAEPDGEPEAEGSVASEPVRADEALVAFGDVDPGDGASWPTPVPPAPAPDPVFAPTPLDGTDGGEVGDVDGGADDASSEAELEGADHPADDPADQIADDHAGDPEDDAVTEHIAAVPPAEPEPTPAPQEPGAAPEAAEPRQADGFQDDLYSDFDDDPAELPLVEPGGAHRGETPEDADHDDVDEATEAAADQTGPYEPAAETAETAEPDEPAEADETDAFAAHDHDGLTSMASWDDLGQEPPAAAAPPRVTRRPVARLLVSDGQEIDVDRTVILGRAPMASRFSESEQPLLVRVESPHQEISSTHVEVRPGAGADHGTAVATDLGSTNGTVVTQPGLDPDELHPGVSVQLVPGAVIDLGDGVTIQVVRP